MELTRNKKAFRIHFRVLFPTGGANSVSDYFLIPVRPVVKVFIRKLAKKLNTLGVL